MSGERRLQSKAPWLSAHAGAPAPAPAAPTAEPGASPARIRTSQCAPARGPPQAGATALPPPRGRDDRARTATQPRSIPANVWVERWQELRRLTGGADEARC